MAASSSCHFSRDSRLQRVKVCLRSNAVTVIVAIFVAVKVYIVSKATDRMGLELNLPVKCSVIIGTVLNFDGDGDGVGTCKHTLNICKGKKT